MNNTNIKRYNSNTHEYKCGVEINAQFYTRQTYEYHIGVMVKWWAHYSLEMINELMSEYNALFAF